MIRKSIYTLMLCSFLFAAEAPFKPFTGKVIGKRVRLRSKPTIEAQVIDEMRAGDLFIVMGEADDFYAVAAPKGTKAYLFRKFVLDGVIEGSRVNVRLAPTIDAPVIAQLNTGDAAKGNVSPINAKWLEIPAPDSARFYIAKDYIDNIGGPELFHRLDKKREKVNDLLDHAKVAIPLELEKPFADVQIDKLLDDLAYVASEESEFPQQANEAREMTQKTKEAYLERKLQHLESQATWEDKHKELKKEIQSEQDKLASLERQVQNPHSTTFQKASTEHTPQMASWDAVEQNAFQKWNSKQEVPGTIDEYYQSQMSQSALLRGRVEPYYTSVKNPPGDYVIVNTFTNVPVGYIYSNQVNLQAYAGKEVEVVALPRPNKHFAFPAYFVLRVE